MAYVERFFKEINCEGHVTRLSIKERVRATAGASTPMEIGDFAGLSLQIQGQQASIETPVVKTSLTFSMYDTTDKQDTAHVKFGGWERFYTPDQTLWLVELRQDGTLTWSGYITPDSWEDDLVYRGIIKITARDMIGHMADFEVQADDFTNIATKGVASIADIIQQAFYVAQVPMSLAIHSSAPWLTYEGAKLYNWGLDITALIGKNWYEAVEGILDAFGLTLRYSGRDSIVLAPVRNAPLCGYASAGSSFYAPQFLRRSGHRELVPAYKQVVETLNYEPHADFIDTFPDGAFSGNELNKDGWEEVTLSGGSWTAGRGIGVIRQYTAANTFNDIVGDRSRYFFLFQQPLTSGSSQKGLRRTAVVPPCVSVDVSFKLAHTYNFRGDVVTPYETMMDGRTVVYVEWLKPDGSSLWLSEATGTWGAAMSVFLSATNKTTDTNADVSLNIATPDTPGTLRIYFYYGTADTTGIRAVRVGDFSVSVSGDSIPQSQKVTTAYDSAQNTTVKRSPKFGTVPEWIKSAGGVRNGVYLMDAQNNFPPVRGVQWNGTGATLPLSVFVHMQHIAMHAKANNVLTGEIRELSGDAPGVDAVWKIFDRQFILVSGTIDYTTGFVGGAVLVEFDPYETVWAGLSVDYKTDAGGYRAPSGGSSSSTSSSSQGGGSSEPYVLPKATETSLGGVAVGYFPQGANLTVEIDANGNLYVPLTDYAITAALGYTPGTGSGGSTNPYVLPLATSSVRGGLKIGYTASDANIPLKLSSEKGYVTLTKNAVVSALGFTPAVEGSGGGAISVATSLALGGIKIGYQATGANVPVQLSSEKAYVQFTRAAIVAALGFVPANENDIGQGGGSGTSELIDRTAPKLRLLKGESYRGAIYEKLMIEHPNTGKTGAELVLMVYNRRTGAIYKRSQTNFYRRSSKKWCVAMGSDAARVLVLHSGMDPDFIRDYLVQEYLCDGGGSRENMRRWDYSDWMSYSCGGAGFGFGNFGNGWMGKLQKRFGVALRIPNPDFEAQANLNIHTQMAPDRNGVKQPRWLYTEVAPLTVQIANDRTIRFSLLEP